VTQRSEREHFVVSYKRLEQGTFKRVRKDDGRAGVEIDAGEFAMLLEGIDARHVRRRKRYKTSSQAEQDQSAHDS